MNGNNTMRLAVFKVDITPPIGFPLAYGVNNKIDSHIYMSGIILDDGNKRIVFVSADVIGISGDAHIYLRKIIAKASETSVSNVFLHAVHQHDSIRIKFNFECVAKAHGIEPFIIKDFFDGIMKKIVDAVKKSVSDKWVSIVDIGTSESRLSGLASNRRLLDENGKVHAMRWSMTCDKDLQDEPVGVIDPILRTLTFNNKQGKPVAALHFYASHPMAAYRRNMVGADVPGVARDYAGKHYGKDVLNIYFNGCGGNVTFGKFAINPPEKSLKILGERLGKGIIRNLNSYDRHPVSKIKIKKASFEIPFMTKIERDRVYRAFPDDKVASIIVEEWTNLKKEWDKWRKVEISRISIGDDIHILSMFGETVVEYQLYAQSLIPEKFLACAAYSNSIYDYIPTAIMFDEGGYETDAGSFTTPDIELLYKEAIKKVLEEPICKILT